MQNIGGVACRRSEVANVTVAAASAISWSQTGFPWGLSYSGHYRQANL